MPTPSLNSLASSARQVLARLTAIRPKRDTRTSIGIDLGSSSVKVLALGPKRGSAARPVVAQNIVPLEPGQETDPSAVLKAALAAIPVSAKSATLAVSGQWVIMRIVELPTMKPDEMKQALPFEAQRYLPFNIKDVVIDGVTLGPADGGKSWVLIVACKKELIERRLDWAKRAGVELAAIDVDALALVNAWLETTPEVGTGTRAVIDIGHQLTNLAIFKGRIPYLVRDIPWGAEKFLRGVAEQLSTEPEALRERLSAPEPPPELLAAAKVSSEALVTELQLSFDYFENRFGQSPEEILVTGGASRLGALLAGLKSHLTQGVTPWAPVKGLSGEFAVAYGLALRGE